MEQSEVKSDNARNVILSYNEKIYYVSSVNVKIQQGQQGNQEKLQAVFHTKRATDNIPEDLDIEISQGTYDILMEYAKLDKLDLIMVLLINNGAVKYCLMSEDMLKNQTFTSSGCTSKAYIV